MQPRPGRVFADIALDLPRPRDRLSPAFTEAKRVILAALDGSLEANAAMRPIKHATTGSWW
jgi:sulfonate transport system ATP-binding protein